MELSLILVDNCSLHISLFLSLFLSLSLSLSLLYIQSENSKMRQRFTPGAARIGGASPALKGGADSLARPKRHLSLVAIMLILVAIVLGYLVGKWL